MAEKWSVEGNFATSLLLTQLYDKQLTVQANKTNLVQKGVLTVCLNVWGELHNK